MFYEQGTDENYYDFFFASLPTSTALGFLIHYRPEVAEKEEQAREQTMVLVELTKTVPKVEAPADMTPATAALDPKPLNPENQ